MLTKLTLVVALCAGHTFGDVQKKVQEITRSNPGATVQVRVDKKAACYNGMVLTGKDAKLLEQLGK